jgi:hypothetical protein
MNPIFTVNEVSIPAIRAIQIKGYSGVAIFDENDPVYKGTYYFKHINGIVKGGI